MELTQIRYFLEAAESRHITNSAKNLRITQPALTQAIHRLEEDLGVPLFAAKGRNITLTEYGKYLQKKLTPLMEQLDRIPEQLSMMAKLEGETIHMNVLAASGLVMEAIIEYKKQHGEINFLSLSGMWVPETEHQPPESSKCSLLSHLNSPTLCFLKV